MNVPNGEARRGRSAALFNNRHFADVAAAALDVSKNCTTMFTTRMVASSTGLPDSVVRPVLHRLVGAGVLSKLPRAGGGRSAQYFQVLERTAVETVRDLADPLDGDEPTPASARTRPDT